MSGEESWFEKGLKWAMESKGASIYSSIKPSTPEAAWLAADTHFYWEFVSQKGGFRPLEARGEFIKGAVAGWKMTR